MDILVSKYDVIFTRIEHIDPGFIGQYKNSLNITPCILFTQLKSKIV